MASPPRPSPERVSLEGTLRDLKPMELLRLLASTRQTGMLQVLADDPVLLTMVHGEVSFATADPKVTVHDVLRAAGVVDSATWEKAGAHSKANGAANLGDALIELGVDAGAMTAAIRRAVLDTVVDLALAETGRFRFTSGRRHALGERFLYPVEQLADDVTERLSRWGAVQALIPAYSAVPQLTAALASGREDVTISAEDWPVVAAIDGRRSLSELRSAIGTTRFGLGCSLATLVGCGVVEFSAAARSSA